MLDDAGIVIEEQRRPTPPGPEAFVDTLAELAGALGVTDSLGIGVPGMVTRSGVIMASPNLIDITDFEVGRMLSERLGFLVEVGNDATCAAAAEWQVGAARGATDMVMVTLGTGIGGGVVAGGQLIRGANGFTGEIGHMVVDPDGPAVPVRPSRAVGNATRRGRASPRSLGQAAIGKRLRRVVQLAGGDPENVRGENVQAAAREGDADALDVIDTFGRWVALGLANLTNLLDPQMFVLGGGLAASGDLYLGPIQKWFTELLYAPDLRPHPQLVFASLGERAGAVGAALMTELR